MQTTSVASLRGVDNIPGLGGQLHRITQPIFELGILARNGNAFAAYQKTPVEILENKGTCMKVRLLEGEWKGRIGWIRAEFIKSRKLFL
jgi:hypothetical protein